MKKQLIILIVCLLLAAVLGGVLWFLMGYDPDASNSSSFVSQTVSLRNITETTLESVKIENEQGTYTLKTVAENEYTLEGYEDGNLNSTMLSSMAKIFTSLSATEMVAESPEDLAPYGLDQPRVTMTAQYADQSSFKIYLGNDAPGDNGVYGKVEGDPAVYLLSSYTFENAFKTPLEYFLTTITNEPQTTDGSIVPEKLTLEGTLREEPIVLVRNVNQSEEQKNYNLSGYIMEQPRQRAINITDEFSSMLTELLALSADSVVGYQPTEEQLKEFGLDVPYSIIEFSYNNYNNEPKTVRLQLSQPDESGNAYMMKDGDKTVYQIHAVDYLWYELDYPTLISTLQLLPFIDTIDTMTLQFDDGTEYAFKLEGEGDELIVTCNGENISTDKFRKYYQAVVGIPSEEYTTDTPPADSEALLTITYRYREEGLPEDVMRLLPGPTRKMFVSINGFAEFYTKTSYLDTIKKNSESILQNGEISPLY